MVKTSKKKFNKKSYENVESSSDESYGDFNEKDPFNDDEIEAFNNESDKILLNNMSKKKKSFNDISDEEEVLAFDDDETDDDDEDEERSDLEDDVDDEDAQNEDVDNIEEELMKKSWGTKKSSYYYGNKIENEEDAELEEEEAKIMQAKMLKQLDASDFGLDSFKHAKPQKEIAKLEEDEVEVKDVEKITNNLSRMSKSEKLDFLKQESPELFELVREFNAKVKELQEVLLPVYRLIEDHTLTKSKATVYILNKMKLNLMYSCHLSFYFVLKSQRISVENHPIVKNILQFRNLSKQIKTVDEQVEEEIHYILNAVENGQKIKINKTSGAKRVKFGADDEKLAKRDSFKDLKFDDELMDEEKVALENEEQEEQNEQVEEAHIKRAINYEMEKNKGLTPKRNKLNRNPRVKHREKFRKALIKRKSIVPKVRNEDKRYSGEATGIRSTVIRSVKIK